jgi:hypothetical protein
VYHLFSDIYLCGCLASYYFAFLTLPLLLLDFILKTHKLQVFSLWAVSDRKYGGLSFSSQDVGSVLSISGILDTRNCVFTAYGP